MIDNIKKIITAMADTPLQPRIIVKISQNTITHESTAYQCPFCGDGESNEPVMISLFFHHKDYCPVSLAQKIMCENETCGKWKEKTSEEIINDLEKVTTIICNRKKKKTERIKIKDLDILPDLVNPPPPPPKRIIKEDVRLPGIWPLTWIRKFLKSCIEESEISGYQPKPPPKTKRGNPTPAPPPKNP